MPDERPIPPFENPLCIQLLAGFGTKMVMARLAGGLPPLVVSTVAEYIGATPTCTEDHVRNALDELVSHGLALTLADSGEYTPTPSGWELAARLSA